MKTKSILHILTVLLFASVGYLFAAEPITSTNQIDCAVGDETNGLRLFISTTNRIFQVGQPIDLTISLQNASSNSVPILITQKPFSFEIVCPNGSIAAETELGKKMFHSVFLQNFVESIDAKGSFTVTPCLTSLFVMTNVGEYSITVSHKTLNRATVSAGPLKLFIFGSK